MRKLIAERWSADNRRRAMIYSANGSFVIECYQDDNLVNTPSTKGVVRQAEMLAEEFVNRSLNPGLICG